MDDKTNQENLKHCLVENWKVLKMCNGLYNNIGKIVDAKECGEEVSIDLKSLLEKQPLKKKVKFVSKCNIKFIILLHGYFWNVNNFCTWLLLSKY
jgi:hypothetical protein